MHNDKIPFQTNKNKRWKNKMWDDAKYHPRQINNSNDSSLNL